MNTAICWTCSQFSDHPALTTWDFGWSISIHSQRHQPCLILSMFFRLFMTIHLTQPPTWLSSAVANNPVRQCRSLKVGSSASSKDDETRIQVQIQLALQANHWFVVNNWMAHVELMLQRCSLDVTCQPPVWMEVVVTLGSRSRIIDRFVLSCSSRYRRAIPFIASDPVRGRAGNSGH